MYDKFIKYDAVFEITALKVYIVQICPTLTTVLWHWPVRAQHFPMHKIKKIFHLKGYSSTQKRWILHFTLCNTIASFLLLSLLNAYFFGIPGRPLLHTWKRESPPLLLSDDEWFQLHFYSWKRIWTYKHCLCCQTEYVIAIFLTNIVLAIWMRIIFLNKLQGSILHDMIVPRISKKLAYSISKLNMVQFLNWIWSDIAVGCFKVLPGFFSFNRWPSPNMFVQKDLSLCWSFPYFF